MIASAGAGNQIVENVIHDGRAWGIMVRRTEGTLIRDSQIMRHPGFRHEVPEHVSEEMRFGVGFGIDVRLSNRTRVLNNRVGETQSVRHSGTVRERGTSSRATAAARRIGRISARRDSPGTAKVHTRRASAALPVS